jgi:regulator of protease activity HflC (stomatin/prohibitin superfamily)
MEAALAWIGQLANWFGQFFPRWIILNSTEGAVKFVRGSRAVVLYPGIHWYWPAMTEIKAWTVARQSLNLPTQTVTTKDGKTIAVGAVMVFRITNVLLLIARTYDPDTVIRSVALGVVQQLCSAAEWSELQMVNSSGELNEHLRKALQRRLAKRFGIKVLDASLSDLAPCRVIKVVQTTSSDT